MMGWKIMDKRTNFENILHKNILYFYRIEGNRKEIKYCLYMSIQTRVDTHPSLSPHSFLSSWGSASVEEDNGGGHPSLLSGFFFFWMLLTSRWEWFCSKSG